MTQRLELPVAMTGYQHACYIRVIVVGCGGTGGYLVPNLARMIANYEVRTVTLTLLDGDKVEAKNLKRQNFIASDLGKNKAKVLADRYSAALGMPISYVDSYLKDTSLLEELSDPHNTQGGTIVIGCVDNHRTRQVLAKWFRAKLGRFWIDAGNEEMHGQVVCGFHYYPFHPEHYQPFALPCMADLFPEVEQQEDAVFNDEASCAERAIENPQNIATNVLAATYLLAFAQQVIQGNPLQTHGVFFSAEQGSTDAMLNQPSRLQTDAWQGYQGPTEWDPDVLEHLKALRNTQEAA